MPRGIPRDLNKRLENEAASCLRCAQLSAKLFFANPMPFQALLAHLLEAFTITGLAFLFQVRRRVRGQEPEATCSLLKQRLRLLAEGLVSCYFSSAPLLSVNRTRRCVTLTHSPGLRDQEEDCERQPAFFSVKRICRPRASRSENRHRAHDPAEKRRGQQRGVAAGPGGWVGVMG